MPVHIIIFYDHAHVDWNGALGAGPVLISFGWFKLHCLHLLCFWKMLGYVPNLNVGRGQSCRIDAAERQREHHKILSAILLELVDITGRGGIKTVVRGKVVVLNFSFNISLATRLDTTTYVVTNRQVVASSSTALTILFLLTLPLLILLAHCIISGPPHSLQSHHQGWAKWTSDPSPCSSPSFTRRASLLVLEICYPFL